MQYFFILGRTPTLSIAELSSMFNLSKNEKFTGYLASSNVFIVEGDQVLTPSLESGAFDGVTRRAVIQIIRDMNLTVKEERMKIEEITACTEEFITSTLMEVMPLVECEEKPVGNGKPGKTTLKILSEYRKVISP